MKQSNHPSSLSPFLIDPQALRNAHTSEKEKNPFLDDLQDRTDENSVALDISEVREKCLQVLDYLDELTHVKKTTWESISGMEKISQLQSEEDLIDFLSQTEKGETQNKNTIREMRNYIVSQIRDLLSSPEVREFFLAHLKEEGEKYQQAQAKIKTVTRMESAENEALRRIIHIYLQSKHIHGKLVRTAAQSIATLETLRKQVKVKEETERATANEEELGFLKAQELLQYKKQIKQRGFALTPSRKKMISKITDHVLAGRKVFLVGSTGTGKTELAIYVSEEVTGKTGNYEMISWHEGTTPRDLFGYRELWQNNEGHTVSGTKPGPVTKAIQKGSLAIHDEYTTGTTRSQIAAKALMNAKPGQRVHVPGFNGEVFEVHENFAEIFTGNPKDEKTQAREDMDPAILRMLTGLKIDYMPASEMRDIILAHMMEGNGVLALNFSEVEFISKLCKAAELMQMFHNREFDHISSLFGDNSTEITILKGVFGGELRDAKLDKNFLDPGKLFSLFSDFDFSRAKMKNLEAHMEQRLSEFLQDPKFDMAPEERTLAAQILKIMGITVSENPSKVEVKIKPHEKDKGYILPSELHQIEEHMHHSHDPLSNEPISVPEEPAVLTPDTPALPVVVTMSRTAIENKLEEISDTKRLTLEAMMYALENLPGVSIRRVSESYEKAFQAREKILSDPLKVQELLQGAQKIKDHTFNDHSPLIQDPWPRTIYINSEEVIFNWQTLKDIMKKVKKVYPSFCPIIVGRGIEESHWLDNLISKITHSPCDINHNFNYGNEIGYRIGIWSSDSIRGSFNRSYGGTDIRAGTKRLNMLEHQKDVFGSDQFKIYFDAVMAFALHSLVNYQLERFLFPSTRMYLNEESSPSKPFFMRSDKKGILLDTNPYQYYSNATGIGASFSVTDF